MTYKELKDSFFEEVGKVDVSKLELGFGGLNTYAELLKIMAEIPDEAVDDGFGKMVKEAKNAICSGYFGFGGSPVPREEKDGD